MATIFERDYRLRARDLATALVLAERLNPILRSIDLRIGGVEDRSASIAEMEAELRDYGTARIDALLTPIVAAIDAAAGLGALLTTTSGTALEVGEGVKDLFIPQPEALVFAPTATLSIVAVDDPTATMLARRAAWNAATGHLVVEVIAFTGAGIHTSWILSAAAVADNAAQVRTPAQGGLSGATLVQQLAEIDDALTAKLPVVDAALLGRPTCPTPSIAADSAAIVNVEALRQSAAATKTEILGAAPAVIDTIVEAAAALGNDPDFSATMFAQLAGKQPLDATLTALAGLAAAADELIYATGADAFATTAFTAYARALLAAANAPAARGALGLSGALPIRSMSRTLVTTDYARSSGAAGAGIYVAGSDAIDLVSTATDTVVDLVISARVNVDADTSNGGTVEAGLRIEYHDGTGWQPLVALPASIRGVGLTAGTSAIRHSVTIAGRLSQVQRYNSTKWLIRLAITAATNYTTVTVLDSSAAATEIGGAL